MTSDAVLGGRHSSVCDCIQQLRKQMQRKGLLLAAKLRLSCGSLLPTRLCCQHTCRG